MRIGLAATSFPRFDGDVAGSFVLGMARALSTRGHEVSVLAPEPPDGDVTPPRWPGVELTWLRYLRPRSWQRTFYGAGAPDNLRRDRLALLGAAPFTVALGAAIAARGRRWDALCSHWALPCGLAGAATFGLRPHICIFHSADLHLLERLPGRGLLGERLARRCSFLWFVAEDQRRRFLSLLPPDAREAAAARALVQPMGVDLPRQPPVTTAETRRDRFVLLSMGRLVPVKGLVRALATLRTRGDLSLWIAGDGPERERLYELAREAELDVRLLGTVTGAAKTALLCEADALLLPSRVLPSGRSEGAPTVLLEALATGLPVIAADVGGVRELIEHERTGLLFDPEEPSELLRAIDRMKQDDSLRARLREAGPRSAARHAWPVVAARFDALLEDATRRASVCAGADTRIW